MTKVNEPRVGGKGEARQHHEPHHHLSFPNQEERIRQVFGIPAKIPLPPVKLDTLSQYFTFLADRLVFPFDAIYCQAGGEMRQLIHYVRGLRLADPKELRQSSLHGLYCAIENGDESLLVPLAELGVRDDSPNCQLIDDYAYWFVNWQ